MKSLMTFVGILAFNLPNIAIASDFSCPVNANVSNFTCSGTVKVKTLAELNAYRNDLGVVAKKPTIAKNLQIDFNPALTSDLVISTPCLIRIPSNVVMTSTANICLNGTKGIVIDENFKFTGKNLKLESKEEVIINKNSVIKAQDIKLLSIGVGDASKTYIRDGANVEAANLSIESFDKGFIGKNSIIKLTGALGIYSLGDDEASVREGSRVEAAKIEISSTEETRVAKLTTLVASEIVLNGVKCTINKTAVITADDRLGNCFLTSTTNKAKFSINKNQGTNPLAVNFNASSIVDAKGFVWSFGDGETLNSLTPTVTHVYNRVGSFTATLKYATKDNYKGLKSAGAIQIDVKAAPISNPVVPKPPRGDFKYQTDGTFVYLRGFIRKGTHYIANAYYVIDDNQNNKIQIPNFYQNSLTNVEMNTYGRHKVTMNVIDVQGLTHSKSMNVYVDESEGDVWPYMRLDVDQSAARTMFFDLSWSFNPIVGETLKNFTIDFGDGQTAVLTDTAFTTHTYAQAGTYLVRATGQVNGNEDFDEYEIEVTDENTEIMNPVAGFEYQIHDYAGNVMFTNDRSGTPNGEIISYAWDFGDGTVGYGKNATNFYAPGDYLVTLTVTDTAGLRSSQTQKITIVAEGDDIASMLDCRSDRDKHLGCEVVAFDKFNEITRVKLDWGDGTNENLTVADIASTGFSTREHNYQLYGLYKIKLTIDTNRGFTKAKEFEYESVEPAPIPPVADIYCITNGLLVNCNALGSYDPKNTELTYTFNYGDGFSETNKTGLSSHVFQLAGLFDVTVAVKDELGLTSTSVAPVQINLPQNILPYGYLACETPKPLSLRCKFQGADPDGYIVSARYEFDDGATSIYDPTFIFDHIFSTAGTHIVRVTITDNSGGQKEYSYSYEILDNRDPVINGFDCSSYRPLRLSCFAYAYDSDIDDYLTYQWDSENLSTSYTITNANEFLYDSHGEKTVKVLVTDTYGKTATLEKVFVVADNVAPIISFLDCHNVGLLTINCQAYSYDSDGSIQKIKWLLDDGASYEGNSFTHVFSSGGTHKIDLTVIDDLAKEVNASYAISVIENKLPTFTLVANNITGHVPLSVDFEALDIQDVDGTIASYKWYVDDILVSEEQKINHIFENLGSFDVRLRITDNDHGFTERSLTVKTANPSNIIINTDKDNGYIGMEVQFDASASTDPDSELVKFEWFYMGEKVGEGETFSKIFDQSGKQELRLVATNDLGVTTEGFKEILVEKGAIYLEGSAPKNAFAGLAYEASYTLILGSEIPNENVTISLEDAPAGVSFDQITKKLHWMPTIEQAGEHSFKIIVTDGLIQSERQVDIKVAIPRLLGAYNSGSSNRITLSSQSILNGTILTLPALAEEYNLKVYESGDLSKPTIFFRSDKELKTPLDIQFPSVMEVGQFVTVSPAEDDDVDEYIRHKYYFLNEETRKQVCVNSESLEVRKLLSKQYKEVFSDSQFVSGFVHSNLKNDPILMNVVNNLMQDESTLERASLGSYKIKFGDYRAVDPKALAFFSGDYPDTIFISLNRIENQIYAILKFVLYHESYHKKQFQITGCGKKSLSAMSNSLSYKGLIEGAADMYSIRLLDDTKKNPLGSLIFPRATMTDKEAAVFYSYKHSSYRSNIIEGIERDITNGIFIDDEPYRARLFFDNTIVDGLDVLRYFENNYSKYDDPSGSKFGLILITDYLESMGKKIENILLPLVENTKYKKSLGPPTKIDSNLVYFFRESDLFQWNETDSSKDELSVQGKELTITKRLKRFSGVSLRYSIKDLYEKLDLNGHPDKITISVVSSSEASKKIKYNVRSEAFVGDTKIVNRIFTESNGVTSSIINSNYTYDKNSDYEKNEKLIINIVNTAIVDHDITLSIKIECDRYCDPLTGRIGYLVGGSIENGYDFTTLSGMFMYDKKGSVKWSYSDGGSSEKDVQEADKHIFNDYGIYTVKAEVTLDYYKEKFNFTQEFDFSPPARRILLPGATYYLMGLLSLDGTQSIGLLHSLTARFELAGPVNTTYEFVGRADQINIGDCGGWSKTVNHDSFHNSFSCTRRKEDPWKTVASGHNVYQCGGWGCDGIIYGYYIPRSSTTYPQVRVSNADVFDF